MYGRVYLNRLIDLKSSSDLTRITLWFTSVSCKCDQQNPVFSGLEIPLHAGTKKLLCTQGTTRMARKFAHGQGRRWANKVCLKIFLFSLVRLLYPNTAAGGWNNYLPIFDRVEFQEEEEFKKSETHFGSLGPALPAGLSQILLTQTQGYIIAFEGGTLFNQ